MLWAVHWVWAPQLAETFVTQVPLKLIHSEVKVSLDDLRECVFEQLQLLHSPIEGPYLLQVPPTLGNDPCTLCSVAPTWAFIFTTVFIMFFSSLQSLSKFSCKR